MAEPPGDARASDAGASVLRGVVALVDVTNAGDLNASPVFAKRLLALGASVVERLSSKVTHVVFKGKPEALRALHDRLARLPGPCRSVVSVTWVMACADAGARVDEAAHSQGRPPDTLASLVKSPTYHRGGSSHSTKKRKAMEPLPAHRYAVDLDDPAFNSSQMLAQIRSPDLGLESPGGGATPLGQAQVAALVRTAAPTRSRLGMSRDELVGTTTRAGPTSAPAALETDVAVRGGSEPAEVYSPLRPSAALQRALREAATARAQPEEEAGQQAQEEVPPAVVQPTEVVMKECSPDRSPLSPATVLNVPNEPPSLPTSCDGETHEEMDAVIVAAPTVDLPVPPVACDAPMRGTLAVTCATPELADVAHTATKRLRGLRLCPFASSGVTHLVVAEPKRTLKVLHAIARGAWLLTPAWLYASLEAGRWVAEDAYEDATFPGAQASRLARGSAKLLDGLKVAVFEPRRKAPPAAELRALAAAAGATLVKKGPCGVVIIAQGDTSGAAAAAAAHKGAAVVTELWLLDALAAYRAPGTQEYAPHA